MDWNLVLDLFSAFIQDWYFDFFFVQALITSYIVKRGDFGYEIYFLCFLKYCKIESLKINSLVYRLLLYKTVDLEFCFQPDALLIFEDDQKQGKDAICEKIRVYKLRNFRYMYFIR